MDITIKVSEKTEQIIREKAGENGKSVEDFAGILLEEILEAVWKIGLKAKCRIKFRYEKNIPERFNR